MIWLRFRVSSRFGWGFPLLLPVLEETLEEVRDFWSLFRLPLERYWLQTRNINILLRAVLELLRELRTLGPCTLVQVETDEAEVDIRLI